MYASSTSYVCKCMHSKVLRLNAPYTYYIDMHQLCINYVRINHVNKRVCINHINKLVCINHTQSVYASFLNKICLHHPRVNLCASFLHKVCMHGPRLTYVCIIQLLHVYASSNYYECMLHLCINSVCINHVFRICLTNHL